MYSLQDILKGDEHVVFDPNEAKHVDTKKIWLTSIDLYMIARFVKEVNSSEELLINLTEGDVDMFISDLETTNIGKARLNGSIMGSVPSAQISNKPFKEESLAGRLFQYGITHSGGNIYTCFSRDNNPFIEMFVRASEAKRIIYQMLATGSFTNEGIVYMINTAAGNFSKPTNQEWRYYWEIAENQNIPIIARNNSNSLTMQKSSFFLERESDRMEYIPKIIIDRIRDKFAAGINISYGAHARGMVKTINPSIPLSEQFPKEVEDPRIFAA